MKEKKVMIPDLLALKNNWLIIDFPCLILTDVFLSPVHQHIKNLKNDLLIFYFVGHLDFGMVQAFQDQSSSGALNTDYDIQRGSGTQAPWVTVLQSY